MRKLIGAFVLGMVVDRAIFSLGCNLAMHWDSWEQYREVLKYLTWYVSY